MSEEIQFYPSSSLNLDKFTNYHIETAAVFCRTVLTSQKCHALLLMTEGLVLWVGRGQVTAALVTLAFQCKSGRITCYQLGINISYQLGINYFHRCLNNS